MTGSSDTYRTVSQKSESLYKVKGSKHFGYLYPVSSEEDVKDVLDALRKEHHAARHHCYAYRLGAKADLFRANDDGEPANSAGKPILGQLVSVDLTDALIVVVRYFGGTKLGVGGLIDAYRTAAKEAIEANEIIEQHVTESVTVEFTYEDMGAVMKVLKDFNLEMAAHSFEVNCTLRVEVRQSLTQQLIQALEDLRLDIKIKQG